MAGRGLLAELQRQSRRAAQEQQKAARERERARKAALREAERTRKAEERAAAKLERAEAAEQKRLAKERRDAHIAAIEAEVEKRNLELSQTYHVIDTLLQATLDVDDYVDLETLRVEAKHPPFDRVDLESSLPPPEAIPDPPKPALSEPPPPGGLAGLFLRKKHEKAVAQAVEEHKAAVEAWEKDLASIAKEREAAASRYAEMEAKRIADLESQRARYAEECVAREREAVERNKALDELIVNLGYGTVDAVQEYVSIVLSNSLYPEFFPVEHVFEFDAKTAELRLRVSVPSPDVLPTAKAYKYVKSSDEIVEKPLSLKACKDRYAEAVNQVALRSIHEVFEADRRGLIKTISLQVGTDTIDPATGLEGFILFLAVGAERESFQKLDLSNVVPTATLQHLGAAVSKNPFGLEAVDPTGVRRA